MELILVKINTKQDLYELAKHNYIISAHIKQLEFTNIGWEATLICIIESLLNRNEQLEKIAIENLKQPLIIINEEKT